MLKFKIFFSILVMAFSFLSFSLSLPVVAAAPSVPDTKKVNIGSGEFSSIFDFKKDSVPCKTYQCWIKKVWSWSTVVMIPLSVIMLIWAGVLFATSGGNPDRISLAKKIILGVVSGIALIVLTRVLLLDIIGVDYSNLNVK